MHRLPHSLKNMKTETKTMHGISKRKIVGSVAFRMLCPSWCRAQSPFCLRCCASWWEWRVGCHSGTKHKVIVGHMAIANVEIGKGINFVFLLSRQVVGSSNLKGNAVVEVGNRGCVCRCLCGGCGQQQGGCEEKFGSFPSFLLLIMVHKKWSVI